MRFTASVEIRLRAGIADPEGATVERALPVLGFTEIADLRAGKMFRFSVEAETEDEAKAQAEQLADRLLANPVIEESYVEIFSGATV
jgi:phosphoribosylformylglycinamidine synthase